MVASAKTALLLILCALHVAELQRRGQLKTTLFLADTCTWFRASPQFLVLLFALSADATCPMETWMQFAKTLPITEDEALAFWDSLCLWAPPPDLHTIDDRIAAWHACIRK